MAPRVIVRVDASVGIGSGHVMRCLTIGHELAKRGAEVFFACRELEGNLVSYIEGAGFPVFRSAQLDPRARTEELLHDWEDDATVVALAARSLGRPSWLIVDHYGLDQAWERKMRGCVEGVFVIDDLANRPHDCDVLLDQNFYLNSSHRYPALVPESCVTLLGPRYALLRPEFWAARGTVRSRSGMVRRMLVFFGGADPDNLTERAINAIDSLGLDSIRVDVVVGSSNPHRHRISELCSAHNGYTFYQQINNMAELMTQADLALGAGGATTWERCLLGVPTIVVTTADNQIPTTTDLFKEGICLYAGNGNEVTVESLRKTIRKAAQDPEGLRQMSAKAMALSESDGRSGTMAIADLLLRR